MDDEAWSSSDYYGYEDPYDHELFQANPTWGKGPPRGAKGKGIPGGFTGRALGA